MTPLINICKAYATECHNETNHTYAGRPYEVHLEMVYTIAKNNIHLLPKEKAEVALAACWTHDVIEDCRQTYNDVRKRCGFDVAEITFALTNEKGKTRKDRANEKYYTGIRGNVSAHFVKLCDRLANIQFSYDTNSTMLSVYQKEHEDFKRQMYADVYADLFFLMEAILFNK